MMEDKNCQKCRYHYWMLELLGRNLNENSCDKCGSDLCRKLNDPDFIQYMEERGGDLGW